MSLNVNNKYQTVCDITANYDTAGQSNDKQYIRFTMRYTQGITVILTTWKHPASIHYA